MPFHCCSTPLGPGSIILPGNWGRIVGKLGFAHGAALRELVLEDVRAREFPSLPSRLACAFAIETLEDAIAYRNAAALVSLIYEVDFVDPAASHHQTDYALIAPSGALNLDWARAYWRGSQAIPSDGRPQRTEILTMSPLRILARIEA